MRLRYEQALWVSIGTFGAAWGCGETPRGTAADPASSSTNEVASGDDQSDAGSGPRARLAVSISLASCGVDGRYSLPEDDSVFASSEPDISATQLADIPRLVNGEGGASVSCSVVHGPDNRLSFSASAGLGNTRRFTLNTGESSVPSDAASAPGTADVSFLHPRAIPVRTGHSCDVNVALTPAGEMLVDFECLPPNSTFQAANIDTPNCQAVGRLVIDRCATE